MSDDPEFEKWWEESPEAHRFSTAREKVVTYAAYQAGQENAQNRVRELEEALAEVHGWAEEARQILTKDD